MNAKREWRAWLPTAAGMVGLLLLLDLSPLPMAGCVAYAQDMAAGYPDEIVDSWIVRQKTAVQDWVRRVLGLPDPYQPPAPTPDDPTPDVGNVTGSGSFLWKPVSENDGKAVVILPCEYRLDSANDPWRTAPNAKVIEAIRIEGGDRDGDKPRTSYWPEGRNGNRIHNRMSAKGEDFGKGFDVVVSWGTGQETRFRIKDGAKRQG